MIWICQSVVCTFCESGSKLSLKSLFVSQV